MDAGVRPHKGLGLVWVVTGLFSGVGCPKRAPPSEPCARTVAREFEARPTTRVSLKQELQVLETRCHERPPAPLGSLADFDEELGPIGMAPTAPTMGTAELRALAERGCSSGANDARESCWLEDDELAALATEGCWLSGMDLPAWALRGWMIGEGIDRAHADAVARLFLSEPPVSTFRPAFRLPQTESGAVPLVLARVPALTIELELGGIARLDDRAVLVADLEVPPPTSPDDSDPSVLLAIHTSTPLSDALPLLGSVRAVGHQRALLALSTPDGPEAFGVVRVELDEIPVADAGDCDATFGVLVSQLPEPEWDRGAPDCAPPQAASLARVIPSLCK